MKTRNEELKKRSSRVIDHFPELRSGRSSLVIIDGEMKSLTSEFIEQVNERRNLLIIGVFFKIKVKEFL